MIKLIHGECLEEMAKLESGSIDMVCTDPPYQITSCKWDTMIPLEPMWAQLKRLIKPNGAIVMTASQPFTTTLIASNMDMFKYCWVWEKTKASNFTQVNKQPLKKHEDVCVWYSKHPTYNAQLEEGEPYQDNRTTGNRSVSPGNRSIERTPIDNDGTRFPSSVQKFSNGNNNTVHPTQKPVALMQYLIKTYTNEGETVLDFTMGSGTTGVACRWTNRNFIGIELEEKYYKIAQKRIAEVLC